VGAPAAPDSVHPWRTSELSQTTPDEFDSIITLPPPPPRLPKRPLVTWRDLRMLVLCTVASIALMVALLYGLAALIFLPY